MNLLDMSPDAIALEINGNEYPLQYTFLSLRELTFAYGSEEAYHDAVRRIMTDLGKAKREDFTNFLLAGLVGGDFFPPHLIDKRFAPWRINREGAREHLDNLLVPRNLGMYALAIIQAWTAANINEDMMEILEIMAAGQEKKTEADVPNGQAGSPSPQ